MLMFYEFLNIPAPLYFRLLRPFRIVLTILLLAMRGIMISFLGIRFTAEAVEDNVDQKVPLFQLFCFLGNGRVVI